MTVIRHVYPLQSSSAVRRGSLQAVGAVAATIATARLAILPWLLSSDLTTCSDDQSYPPLMAGWVTRSVAWSHCYGTWESCSTRHLLLATSCSHLPHFKVDHSLLYYWLVHQRSLIKSIPVVLIRQLTPLNFAETDRFLIYQCSLRHLGEGLRCAICCLILMQLDCFIAINHLLTGASFVKVQSP